jgi:predicted nucleic acid-binding protein
MSQSIINLIITLINSHPHLTDALEEIGRDLDHGYVHPITAAQYIYQVLRTN